MTCEEVREGLSARIDAQLSAEDAQRLQAHLQQCPACLREQKAQEALWRLLDLAEAIEVPAEFAALTRARVQGTAPAVGRGRTVLRFRRWAAPLAAAAAALLAIGIFFPHQHDEFGTGGLELSPDEMDVVANLDVVEDLDVVASLDLIDAASSPDEILQLLEVEEEILR
ncbi:MAG: zf-HC2 domain-containing protein [Planctomycetes bacterium]|nr:zf-HC2 domain-containing protein [Planctomycetota bacterium]